MRSIPLTIETRDEVRLRNLLRDMSEAVRTLRAGLYELDVDEFEDNLAAIEETMEEAWKGGA